MSKTPVKTLLAAILLIFILTACRSEPMVQYGGTYAYGNPDEGCGQVEIYPENDTTLLFHLYVNRGGPSYNNGEIEGRIVVRDGKAVFRKNIGYMPEECLLEFEFYDDSIRIATPDNGCNCGFGHGVYADGTYLRTSSDIPQYYTSVAGDMIRFDQWQDESELPEQPAGSSPYARIDDSFIAFFPDLVLGAPFSGGKLLSRQTVAKYLPDLCNENQKIYAIGKILDYRGLNLFVFELDGTRPDEQSYDNHTSDNIALLVYDKNGFACQIDNNMSDNGDPEPGRAIHQLGARYQGEGGEWTYSSSFTRDTSLLCSYYFSECESATGYQTPFVQRKHLLQVITPQGDTRTADVLEQRFSSPFYDCKFLAAQTWDEVRDEGPNRTYPTRNNKWQLINEEAIAFPVVVFFHIERIDGVLTPVFSTSQSDDSHSLFRYLVGHPSESSVQTDTAPTPGTALIETSDGDLEVLPDGKFVLHRR